MKAIKFLFNSFIIGVFMLISTTAFLGALTGCADHGGTETVIQKGDQGPVGPQGPQGEPGQDGEDGQDGANCGTVQNDDGSVTLLCEGSDPVVIRSGEDGEDGLDGTGCDMSSEDGDGCFTVTCANSYGFVCNGEDGEDGQDGQDGEDGYTSLIKSSNEPVGTNCPYGGVKFQTGIDDDRDGILDSNEVDNTEYACHGAPTPDECNEDKDCQNSDLCDGVEKCEAGVCKDGPNLVCNDGKTETSDTCIPSTGCHYSPTTCTDNLNCTIDTWTNGVCVSQPKNCDDGNGATTDSCNPTNGVCVHNSGCQFDIDCDDGDVNTTDLCEDDHGCTYVPKAQCKSLTVEAGWAFLFSRGPKSGTGNWVPLGNWRSCDENNAAKCRTMSWCGDDTVMFNVQQLPNVSGADWLVRNARGDSPCQSDADAVLNYTPADLFAGSVPTDLSCSLVCDQYGYTNYRCPSAQ